MQIEPRVGDGERQRRFTKLLVLVTAANGAPFTNSSKSSATSLKCSGSVAASSSAQPKVQPAATASRNGRKDRTVKELLPGPSARLDQLIENSPAGTTRTAARRAGDGAAPLDARGKRPERPRPPRLPGCRAGRQRRR